MSGPSASSGEMAPLAGAALAVTALALALGTFMQVLDGTIANVSLTTIAGNLGVSSDTGTWVITSFGVANGITVPLTGWLMGRFGVVRTFVVSVTLFTIASLLCGVAWSISSLVIFRVIQGAVSGPMIPGSQALLISIFPPQKRSTALAIWSMTTMMGPIAGPIMGGYISDNYHWGWIFLINIPVGLLAAFVSWRFLHTRETPTRKIRIDRVGLFLLAFWVGSLQIVLDLGKNADWFNSTMVVILSLCAGIGFLAWVIWELTDSQPIVDLSLFKKRNFGLGTLALSLGYALFFGNALLLPLWLQQQMGYTATWAGLVSAPSGMVAVVMTPIVATLSRKLDSRWLGTISFAAFGLSYWMRAGYAPDTDYWHFMTPLLLNGVAMSFFFVGMLNISLDGIPPERVPSATGLSNFARITGGSFAASLAVTLWDRREALHQSRLVDVTSAYAAPFVQATAHLKAAGMSDPQAAAMITRQVVGQSYLLAVTDIFWICGWISFAMIGLIWLTNRAMGNGGPVAAD